MRDTNFWKNRLLLQLKRQWPTVPTPLSAADLCNVELGLYLLFTLMPKGAARSLWTLLTGYPFPAPEIDSWSQAEQRMLSNARHILPFFRSHYPWERALARYREIDSRLRGFSVDSKLENFEMKPVSVATNRWQIYSDTLSMDLPFKKSNYQWATAEAYQFPDNDGRFVSATIPTELVSPPPDSHSLQPRQKQSVIEVTWDELLETAKWMDSHIAGSWEDRLSSIQLELFNTEDILEPARGLSLQGLTNLIGMVSSGKSTLMDILAVCAARRGLHITLVVSDVMNAMDRAQLFNALGISSAPILGASNRVRHTNRLHAALAMQSGNPLAYEHSGFKWLSTACIVDALKDNQTPLHPDIYPCQSLQSRKGRFYACPIYSRCPFHQAQRDLIDASIWISTIASLVYTRVAPQINAETIRFSELVHRHSDLIIVDEADQVQAQLDVMFSPSQILVSRGADWLGHLWQRVVPQLDSEGRGQLAVEEVDRWCQAHEIAQTTTNRLYSLLLQEYSLQNWIGRDYFTDWTLFDRLATELSLADMETRFDNEDYKELMDIFRAYMEDPLGEQRDHPLSDLAEKTVLHANERIRPRLENWLAKSASIKASKTSQLLDKWTSQLQFSLLLAVLQDRLNYLVRDWKLVEQPLNLEAAGTTMFYSPPEDYNAVIPASPMGNVLAFQYLQSSDGPQEPGDLRFFRCSGVGRWFLLHLHELFLANDKTGPSVVLLSGTSWAGTSPSYHIQAPVSGILRAPEAEVKAIAEESIFSLQIFFDDHGLPLKVSGRRGAARLSSLKEILNNLALPGGLGGPSRLERERQQLPSDRRNILLLVGSYEEANVARAHLESIRPDWHGQVVNLIPDDAAYDDEWREASRVLQRGRVAQFADLNSWLLIAPLLAIERGHNILNESRQAAIGAAYFLVRPHPHPTDLSFAIQSINQWAISTYQDKKWLATRVAPDPLTLINMARAFRNTAYRRWRYLLSLPLIYSTLPASQREAITWSALVTIWQVIGRLIRGGSPARIYFCDSAFATHSAQRDGELDTPETSLLVGMRSVLRPYFTNAKNAEIPLKEKMLVQALYGPFYSALKEMRGIADAFIQ